MHDFESGVASYIHGQATVDVFFFFFKSEDADICCYQCYYFRRNYQTCRFNRKNYQYPSKYVGSLCPLKFIEKQEETNEQDE